METGVKNELAPIPYDELFVCFLGIERSKAVSKAFNAAGKFTTSFEGGTRKMSKMTPDAIKKQVHPETPVTIIYEERSKDPEYQAYRGAIDKLKLAGIPYKISNVLHLMARLRELDIDLSDYL